MTQSSTCPGSLVANVSMPIGTIDLLVASEIGENRTLVIAVGRDDVPSAALGLQAVLA